MWGCAGAALAARPCLLKGGGRLLGNDGQVGRLAKQVGLALRKVAGGDQACRVGGIRVAGNAFGAGHPCPQAPPPSPARASPPPTLAIRMRFMANSRYIKNILQPLTLPQVDRIFCVEVCRLLPPLLRQQAPRQRQRATFGLGRMQHEDR